ncbi:MAG: hypothetical protein V1790_16365 [Planctomycetota bacterium]
MKRGHPSTAWVQVGIGFALAVAATTGCSPFVEAFRDIQEEHDDRLSCEAAGGNWITTRDGSACQVPITDVGKPCRDSSECQVVCKSEDCTEFGECSAEIYGCYCMVSYEGTDMICVDPPF